MPRPIADRPYPFDPVQRYMNLTGITDEQLGVWTGSASRMGARRKVQRWKIAGMTEMQADAVAARLHLHPSALWGRYWWTLVPMDQNDDRDESHEPTEGAFDDHCT